MYLVRLNDLLYIVLFKAKEDNDKVNVFKTYKFQI